MKKRIHGKKLSRTTNERKQLFRNLTSSLIDHGFIVTTLAKAKALKPNFEKLVTRAKIDSLANVRRLTQETGDFKIAQKFLVLGKLFEARPGGYTRIIHLGNQKGDNSPVVRLELVEKVVIPETVVTSKKESVTEEKEVRKREKLPKSPAKIKQTKSKSKKT